MAHLIGWLLIPGEKNGKNLIYIYTFLIVPSAYLFVVSNNDEILYTSYFGFLMAIFVLILYKHRDNEKLQRFLSKIL